MLNIRTYHRAESLEEAWALNQKKSNCVLGGGGWLRLGTRNIGTAIDLSGLGLDAIEETSEFFSIGCMATLRQVEIHPGLQAYTAGALRESLRHIVGVQFRNCATIGGSVWGRFGFSDPLTCLLALDTEVELYKKGRTPLAEFVNCAPDRDILLRVIVRKTPRRVAYQSFRNTATDFPVLTCCVSRGEEGWRAAVGARPARATLVTAPTAEELAAQVDKLAYRSNQRGSGEFRRHLAQVLLERCVNSLKEGERC